MADDVLKELNIARQQPLVYIEHLQQRRKLMTSKGIIFWPGSRVGIQTREGYAGIDEAIQFLQEQCGVKFPELRMSPGMCRACQDLINTNGPSGVVGHTGADGSTLTDRVNRYGNWVTTIGENIDYGNTDPVRIVSALIVDDGVPNRGHRVNIFNPMFTVVGIALGPHKTFNHSCVIDFAGGYTEADHGESNAINYHDYTNNNDGPPPLPPKPGAKKSQPAGFNPVKLHDLKQAVGEFNAQRKTRPENPPNLPPQPNLPPRPKSAAGPATKIAEFSIGGNPFAKSDECVIEMDQSQPHQFGFKPRVGKSDAKITANVVNGNTMKFEASFSMGRGIAQSSQTFQLPFPIDAAKIKIEGTTIIVRSKSS